MKKSEQLERIKKINSAIEKYAEAYKELDNLQIEHDSYGANRLIPRGDQKTGAIAEFYVLNYLKSKNPDKTVKLAENLSQKAYDIVICQNGKGDEENDKIERYISVKAVSAYSQKRKTSPIHRSDRQIELHLLYLDHNLFPENYWIIQNVNEFLNNRKNPKKTTFTVKKENIEMLLQQSVKIESVIGKFKKYWSLQINNSAL